MPTRSRTAGLFLVAASLGLPGAAMAASVTLAGTDEIGRGASAPFPTYDSAAFKRVLRNTANVPAGPSSFAFSDLLLKVAGAIPSPAGSAAAAGSRAASHLSGEIAFRSEKPAAPGLRGAGGVLGIDELSPIADAALQYGDPINEPRILGASAPMARVPIAPWGGMVLLLGAVAFLRCRPVDVA